MAKSAEINRFQASHQATPALDEKWFHDFLKSGCVLSSGLGRTWVGWGAVQRTTVAIDGRLSIYAPDFLLEEARPWLVYENATEIAAAEIAIGLETFYDEDPIHWQGPAIESFAPAFADVQAKIADGTLLKAVPSVVRTSPAPLATGHRARAVGKALRLGQSFPMLAYGFWTEDGDGMVGAFGAVCGCEPLPDMELWRHPLGRKEFEPSGFAPEWRSGGDGAGQDCLFSAGKARGGLSAVGAFVPVART